ncbi:MAG: Polyhydroxyalkanoic acid synthase [Micavibrio sp.]|nr:Polyhydroxyalkanoic acid synthase [Micavibrio sp.]
MDSSASPHRAAPRPLSVYLGAAMTLPGVEPLAVENMVRGIQKYQAHGFRRAGGKLEVVWTGGGSTLSFCPAAGEKCGAVFLIPSMINGSEILDLLPGKSFTRWMAEQGFNVYLLDWGNPAEDTTLQSLQDVTGRIVEIASFIQQRTREPVEAVGYCMGGTLLLGAAADRPGLFGKLVLLSAPWDFHAGDPRMMAQVMTGTPTALQLLEVRKALPVDWIQNIFARVNPALAIKKFSNFAAMAAGSAEEEMFIAVEDWLNGGHDLSAGVARACILDWYGANKPAKGEWVDLSVLKNNPVLIVAADRDILVPPESALAATKTLSHASAIRPDCGHISLMAGKNAQQTVWLPVRTWLGQK